MNYFDRLCFYILLTYIALFVFSIKDENRIVLKTVKENHTLLVHLAKIHEGYNQGLTKEDFK